MPKAQENNQLANLGRNASQVVHDLRNPLSAIRNVGFLLKRKLAQSDPAFKQYLELLDQQVLVADRLVSNVMAMANCEPLSLGQVAVVHMIDAVKEQAFAHCVDNIQCLPKAQEAIVWGDQKKLILVITNLMSVIIGLASDSQMLKIDYCQGEQFDQILFQIPQVKLTPEMQKGLADNALAESLQGQPLLLAISQLIVTQHGGRIVWAKSHFEKTIFSINLPRK